MAIPSYTTFKHHNITTNHHNSQQQHNITSPHYVINSPQGSRVRKSRNITSLMLDDHDQVPGCAALSQTLHHISSRIGNLRLTDNTLRIDTLCVDADTLLKFTHSYIHTLRECTVETQFDTLRGHKQYIARIFHPA